MKHVTDWPFLRQAKEVVKSQMTIRCKGATVVALYGMGSFDMYGVRAVTVGS